VVRRALISDADPMAGIIVSAWQKAYTGIVYAGYSATLNREKYSRIFTGMIEKSLQIVFVFERDKSVLGFVSGKTQEGKYDSQVVGLYVQPEEQGRGIGSILLDQMMKHLESENCKTAILWTLLGAQNNSFYKKHGGAEKEFKDIWIGTKTYPGIGYVFNLLHSET